MKLIIVRHGQTASQHSLHYVADEDGLSDVGWLQARALGVRLRSEQIDATYCSDSRRALQTLEGIEDGVVLDRVAVTKTLREGSVGSWVALPSSTRRDIAESEGTPIWRVVPPGGESWIQVTERIAAWLDETRQLHHEETVLVVAHGRINTLAIRLLEGEPWSSYSGSQQPHASISIIEWDGERASVLVRDDNSFLKPCLRTS